MPYMNGFEVIERLQQLIPEGAYIPILVLTADITTEAKQKALSIGARDFITKPFDYVEVLLRIKNLLETRHLHLQIQNQNYELEAKVRKRTQELEASQMEMLDRLAHAAEYRDDDTGEHIKRVGRICNHIATALGLSEQTSELIRLAAPLHDVGKIAIPDSTLLKPARLTPEEFEVVKTHTLIGARMLGDGHSDLMKMAERIALTHHERWDGTGYPAGLAGEEIPIEGRITSVADVFDALTNERPYKAAWSREDALAEIRRQTGKQFDPAVVEVFLDLAAAGMLSDNAGALPAALVAQS
jgi:putative two-component system response regulator